ncbi:hypothetical protein P280DRAFT_18332 [Massarina eburnea CBS 473.64]|uniref:Uncharacterized protein n=1 Tax=Massarina eburnea CBS 473.64 TaxID=1395130 RepID=A0A6A6SHC6_9PLEO|nr:hypothetical protein P280DRAFT_18332 [Massarina eburnea CBS 473.64]
MVPPKIFNSNQRHSEILRHLTDVYSQLSTLTWEKHRATGQKSELMRAKATEGNYHAGLQSKRESTLQQRDLTKSEEDKWMRFIESQIPPCYPGVFLKMTIQQQLNGAIQEHYVQESNHLVKVVKAFCQEDATTPMDAQIQIKNIISTLEAEPSEFLKSDDSWRWHAPPKTIANCLFKTNFYQKSWNMAVKALKDQRSEMMVLECMFYDIVTLVTELIDQ